MSEQEKAGGGRPVLANLWRGHRDRKHIIAYFPVSAGCVALAAVHYGWGTGGARWLTGMGLGLLALTAMLLVAGVAGVEWARECRHGRSLPPTPGLTGRVALEVADTVYRAMPWFLPVFCYNPLLWAMTINGVAWLSCRHPWLPRGYPTISNAAEAWVSLALSALLLALYAFLLLRLLSYVRDDVRFVTKVTVPPEGEPL
jgi:hypothetical protein